MSIAPRKIGNSFVSAVGYGAMGISRFYGAVLPTEERLKDSRSENSVYESGCTHWDTADGYGDSEELIGQWLAKTGKRNEIFLATKFGFVLGDPLPDGRRICGDPEYAKQAIDRSLEKLGVEYVDLWYYHRADRTVPIELTIGAMAEVVKAGKVKYLGISECSAETLRRAHAVHPITALQVEYSPFTLDIEDDKNALLKTARELGIKIVAYSPVGRGLLTGKIRSPDDLDGDDGRRQLPRFSKENFPNVLKLVDNIKVIADKHNATPGQVALAWLLAQGEDVLPIPGSTKPANIKENMDAVKVTLTVEEIEAIRKLAENADAVLGPRYPPAFAALLLADTPPLQK